MLNLMKTENFLNFSRYAQQTEQLIEGLQANRESIHDDGWHMNSPSLTPPVSKVTQLLFNNKNEEIPSLMSIKTPATSGLLNMRNGNGNGNVNITGKQQVITAVSSNPSKEKPDLTGIQSHPPGPIQRPTKLLYKNTILSSTAATDTPSTPDVLEQINRLIDHQESLTSNGTDTPVVPTPGVQWTSFSASEWPVSNSNNQHLSWPTSSTVANPFAAISTATSQSPLHFSSIDNEKTTSDEDENKRRTGDSVWSTVLLPSTSESKTTTTIVTNKNNEKESNSSWLKFWQCPDPEESTNNNVTAGSTTDGEQGKETSIKNKHLWSPLESMNLDSLASTTSNTSSPQPPSPSTGIPQTWWPMGSDKQQGENNNDDDEDEVNKQSKWDFAR